MLYQDEIIVPTEGRGYSDISARVNTAVTASGVQTGLCHLFIRHTSASLMICENADPAVLHDLEAWMSRTVPDGDPLFTHVAEGPDDMPAHIRSILTRTDLMLPVRDGACALGTWQGVYLWEHRQRAHERHIVLTVQGQESS